MDELAEAIREAEAMGMTARAAAWAATARGLAGHDEPGRRGVLRRDGRRWLVSMDDRAVLIEDLVGMRYIAALVAQPGVEMTALALASGGEAAEADALPQLVLDDEARAAYAEHARALLAELDEARDHADIGRAERARAELDLVADELARGVGLGGRVRPTGGSAERARINVQRRIASAINRMGEVSPPLGRYLTRSIRTGAYCVYEPE